MAQAASQATTALAALSLSSVVESALGVKPLACAPPSPPSPALPSPALPLAECVELLLLSSAEVVETEASCAFLVDVTGGQGTPAERAAAALLASGGSSTALGRQLVALGAIEGLTHTLVTHHTNPALLANSAAALRNICELTEGAAPQLVQAVCPLAAALAAQPLSAAVTSTVALALQAMCATGAVPVEACLPALLPLASAIRLQAASTAAWAEAAMCIAKIVEGSPPRQWNAVEAGAVGALAAALTAQLDAREARPTAAACKALEAISSGSDACKAACLESVPALMVALYGHGHEGQVSTSSITALSNIAQGSSSARRLSLLAEKSLLPTVFAAAALHPAELPVQEAAANLLAALAQGSTECKAALLACPRVLPFLTACVGNAALPLSLRGPSSTATRLLLTDSAALAAALAAAEAEEAQGKAAEPPLLLVLLTPAAQAQLLARQQQHRLHLQLTSGALAAALQSALLAQEVGIAGEAAMSLAQLVGVTRAVREGSGGGGGGVVLSPLLSSSSPPHSPIPISPSAAAHGGGLAAGSGGGSAPASPTPMQHHRLEDGSECACVAVARALTASLSPQLTRKGISLSKLQSISEALVEVAGGSAGCKAQVLLAGGGAAVLGALQRLGVTDERVTKALIVLSPELAAEALY